ncbi:hypothetical protein GDO78_015520 [Eleutherodactylus coqui]|uniref:Uncharacterized protein n=1 Tax=Eleutherodactylus coqui TaxID=57060 RepID=A0A8J6EDP3_ELECQ|nr:hypothetical protein GDO78_015520 [Eleutherodactylus coqui]
MSTQLTDWSLTCMIRIIQGCLDSYRAGYTMVSVPIAVSELGRQRVTQPAVPVCSIHLVLLQVSAHSWSAIMSISDCGYCS